MSVPVSRRISLLFLAAVLLLVPQLAQAQIDPGDPPYCPSRLTTSEAFSQIILTNNTIPVRRNGNQYEVFFTLINEKTFNPDGACNNGDTVIKNSSSANISSHSVVIANGANPYVQRSVFITPTNANSATFYCFKLKYHTDVDTAWKKRGAANLPALSGLTDGVLFYVTLQDC
jgi:hypothetical protein